MIFTYNKPYVGDVLMVIVADSKNQPVLTEKRGQVTRIYLAENGETVAWNIFEVSDLVAISGQGQVFLSDENVVVLNQLFSELDFSERLVNDKSPKFVVGEIVELIPHQDSDHLNICQVNVGKEEPIQIVAGAPNARIGLKTIVALPITMMPNGNLIFPGELRGVKSYGMMCSPRELALPNAPQKRGIIELTDAAIVGEVFNPQKHWKS